MTNDIKRHVKIKIYHARVSIVSCSFHSVFMNRSVTESAWVEVPALCESCRPMCQFVCTKKAVDQGVASPRSAAIAAIGTAAPVPAVIVWCFS